MTVFLNWPIFNNNIANFDIDQLIKIRPILINNHNHTLITIPILTTEAKWDHNRTIIDDDDDGTRF